MANQSHRTGRNFAGTRAAALCLCVLSLLSLAGLAEANTVYVTDVLQLSLHEKENSEGRVLRTLVSGTKLEVLERKNYYVRVRTDDGMEGWTKAAFLVSQKPARMRLNELEARRTETKQALETTQEELSAAQQALTDLQELAAETAAAADEKDRELDRLRAENADFRQRLGVSQIAVPLKWASLGAGVALVVGLVGGMLWFDRRSRRRHGGFRIY